MLGEIYPDLKDKNVSMTLAVIESLADLMRNI